MAKQINKKRKLITGKVSLPNPVKRAEDKAWAKEAQRLKKVNQKVNTFHFSIDGPLEDSVLREYEQYVKALKPGLAQLDIYEWKTQKVGHIEKAKTWQGADRWDKSKEDIIGIEIAKYQNNQYLTEGTQRNYYNSYLLGGGDKTFEEWKSKGGAQQVQAQIRAKEKELAESGIKSSKEISIMIGKLFFGSP